MTYYSQDDFPENSRITTSSVILLAIFVGAVVFILYLALTMPWADEGAAVPAPIAGEPADISAGDLGEVALESENDAPAGDGEVSLPRSQ